MAKMWEGRFSKALDTQADDFNSSIHFDCRMWREDITGSVAHARMLAKCGIITEADRDAIIAGLQSAEQAVFSDLQNTAGIHFAGGTLISQYNIDLVGDVAAAGDVIITESVPALSRMSYEDNHNLVFLRELFQSANKSTLREVELVLVARCVHCGHQVVNAD